MEADFKGISGESWCFGARPGAVQGCGVGMALFGVLPAPVGLQRCSGASWHSWALSSPALQGQGSPQVTGERSFLPQWQAARSSCKTPNRFLKKKKGGKKREIPSPSSGLGSASPPSPGTGTGLPRCVRAPLPTLPVPELCAELDSSLFSFFRPISAVGAGQPPLFALSVARGDRNTRFQSAAFPELLSLEKPSVLNLRSEQRAYVLVFDWGA